MNQATGDEYHVKAAGSDIARPGSGPGDDSRRYMKLEKGKQVAGFRVDELIGAGAMAVVYKATQLSLNRPVALKILPTRFASNPQFVERFDVESATLAALNHPNIVSIIDRGHEGDLFFFAMEFIDGPNLREMIMSGQVGLEMLARIMCHCCDALEYAHAKGIIHRDIKSANIMLNYQGITKLADFGLACAMAEERKKSAGRQRRVVMGTRGYMAPEQQIDASLTDARSDIYSLGAVMYEVLTGDIPQEWPPAPPSERNADVDPRIDQLVLKCLHHEPGERYQTAGQLRDAVKKVRDQLMAADDLCPNCRNKTPVREKRCPHCGQDLSDRFDLCPECGSENRHDVEVCLKCGSNLPQIRQQFSARIGKLQYNAQDMMERQEYNAAIEQLRQVLTVKGRLYEHAREKAKRLIKECKLRKRKHYQGIYERAVGVAREGEADKALSLLKTIPSNELNISTALRQLHAAMERCKVNIVAARTALREHDGEKARRLLSAVGEVWKTCPGYAPVRKELEAFEQNESMADYQIAEADRLIAEERYGAAWDVIEFALSSMPNHPRVEAKMVEIKRKSATVLGVKLGEIDHALAANELETAAELIAECERLLVEDARIAERKAELKRREQQVMIGQHIADGETCFAEHRFEEAAWHWLSASALLTEADPRRQVLLPRIETAQKRARGKSAVAPAVPLPPLPGQERTATVSAKALASREGTGGRRGAFYRYGVVLLVLVGLGAGLEMYRRHREAKRWEPRELGPSPVTSNDTGAGQTPLQTSADKAQETCEVVRIASGHTLVVNYEGEEQNVRLLRVDTPSRGKPGYDQAMDFLSATAQGKHVRIVFEESGQEKKDHYDRLLAYAFVGDKNISVELVRQGLSPYWTKYGEGRFKQHFVRAEKEAREARRGMWGGDWGER